MKAADSPSCHSVCGLAGDSTVPGPLVWPPPADREPITPLHVGDTLAGHVRGHAERQRTLIELPPAIALRVQARGALRQRPCALPLPALQPPCHLLAALHAEFMI